jgi:hypothetical protein
LGISFAIDLANRCCVCENRFSSCVYWNVCIHNIGAIFSGILDGGTETFAYISSVDYMDEKIACANISMSANGRQWEGRNRPIIHWDRPTAGYEFDVVMSLDFPQSGCNERLGAPVMFETRIWGIDKVPTDHSVGGAVKADPHQLVVTRRPLLIPQISWLARLFRDSIMMVLSGLYVVQDKMGIEVVLIESFPVFVNEIISRVDVCMHANQVLQVYSGQLNFVSKLSGFKYLIAHHPIAVGVIVVLAVMTIGIVGVVVASIIRYVRLSRTDDNDMQNSGDDGESLASVSPVSPGRVGETELVGDPPEEAAENLRRRL